MPLVRPQLVATGLPAPTDEKGPGNIALPGEIFRRGASLSAEPNLIQAGLVVPEERFPVNGGPLGCVMSMSVHATFRRRTPCRPLSPGSFIHSLGEPTCGLCPLCHRCHPGAFRVDSVPPRRASARIGQLPGKPASSSQSSRIPGVDSVHALGEFLLSHARSAQWHVHSDGSPPPKTTPGTSRHSSDCPDTGTRSGERDRGTFSATCSSW